MHASAHRVPVGVIQKHRHGTFRRVQVPEKQIKQAGCFQSKRQRQRVIDPPRILYRNLDGTGRLFGQALQPEDADEGCARRYSLVELETDGMRTLDRRDVVFEHALEILARVDLVPHVVQGDADHAFSHQHLGRTCPA